MKKSIATFLILSALFPSFTKTSVNTAVDVTHVVYVKVLEAIVKTSIASENGEKTSRK